MLIITFIFHVASSDVHLPMFIFRCSSSDVHLLMFTVWGLWSDVHELIFIVWSSSSVVYGLMLIIWCSPFNVHRLMFIFSGHRLMFNVECGTEEKNSPITGRKHITTFRTAPTKYFKGLSSNVYKQEEYLHSRTRARSLANWLRQNCWEKRYVCLWRTESGTRRAMRRAEPSAEVRRLAGCLKNNYKGSGIRHKGACEKWN